jgi:Secretion system C-terminal sorting domain
MKYSVTNYSYSGSFPSANGNNAFFTPSTNSVTNNKVCFGSNLTNTYTINVTANNSCGTNSRMLFITVNNCGVRVFPNPASNVVKIEFENPDKLESIPDLIELYDEKKQKKSKSMDISKNKKGLIEMDVSDLPRGTYYLKMTYEKKSEVETIRVILQ